MTPRALFLAIAVASLPACGANSSAPASAPPPSHGASSSPSPLDAGSPESASSAHAAPSEDAVIVPIANDDATWGNRDALVTIVEFGDFQCLFTARVSGTIAELERAYGPEQLRVVWKNRPLSSDATARAAAETAEGVRALAGNAAFWRFSERAFARQAHASDAALAAWAKEAGVDTGAFVHGMAQHAWAAKIERDIALGTKLGALGTPQFFINGVRLGGAQPIDAFEAVIDSELRTARALVDRGVARDRVYALATAENAKSWEVAEKHDDAGEGLARRVPVGASPVRGPKDALVTIVVFEDFESPRDKEVQAAIAKVRTTYGNRVRIAWKANPLPDHTRSRAAAMLALEARVERGDNGFWEAHDAIFASQPKLEDADLERIARTMKLDAARVKSALVTRRYDRVIDEDAAFAHDLPARGTPHFFINGQRVFGAVPFDDLAKAIDAALVNARELVAKGVRPEHVYDEIMKGAVGPSKP